MIKISMTIEDVALKQLESAIWMYAYDFDETATHTVAAAAYELLTKRLGQGDFEEQFSKNIPSDKKGQFWSKFNEPYNFFKHGANQRKNIELLEYDPGSLEIVLMAACYANQRMPATRQLVCGHWFMAFFAIKRPGWFVQGQFAQSISELREKAQSAGVDVGDKKFLVRLLGEIKTPFIMR